MSAQDQLGFDALLQDAAADNAARIFERETAHLPDRWEDALTYHRTQIDDHHAAMLALDFDAAMAIRKDAHLLARKLNGNKPGILASDDAPGCKLDAQARAADGETPLWGQSGCFEIAAAGMTARIDMGSMFGIGATAMPFLGFSVRAVRRDKPFLSDTGYRSFLGVTVTPERGMTTEDFAQRVIEAFVETELRGKLVEIDPKW